MNGTKETNRWEQKELAHDLHYCLAAFASCLLGPIFPSVKTGLILSYLLYKPASRARLLSNAALRNNLSSILEELYVWEEKLYGEVMVSNYLILSRNMPSVIV